MADTTYHIYLHGTGGTNETKPKSTSSHTTPKDNNDESTAKNVMGFISNAQNIANNGASSYVGQGIAALSKVAPWVAVAVAVVKIADNVVSTGFSHLETYTGNYEYSMGFNNLKTSATNVINPVGLIKYQLNRQAQFNLQNQRIEQTRTLIGNSSLSTYKIGV